MSATLTYDRPKVAVTNSTGMLTTILVGEKPDAPGAIGGTGTTGELDARFQMDADESGGADVQDIFKLEAIPVVAADGTVSLRVTVTPILGNAAAGTPQVVTVPHNQNVDAWQSAAGRARQA